MKADLKRVPVLNTPDASKNESRKQTGDGCHIEVWSDRSFEGKYLRIEGPIEQRSLVLEDSDWCDSISSLRVGENEFVHVYSGKDFTGAMVSLGPGQEVADLDEVGIDNEIDSIKLINSIKLFDAVRMEESPGEFPPADGEIRQKIRSWRGNQDANKATVRRFIHELWNQRKLELADEIFSADCMTHQLRYGFDSSGTPRGAESMKHHVSEWLASFPDIHFTIEQMLADDDRVMTQCTARGTHSGTWMGIPATGKAITIQMFVVHRIAKGLIVEDWVLVDSLGVFQQLGVIPPIAELIAAATPQCGND